MEQRSLTIHDLIEKSCRANDDHLALVGRHPNFVSKFTVFMHIRIRSHGPYPNHSKQKSERKQKPELS